MSKFVGGYHTLRPKEDHFSKTMANVDRAVAEYTLNDPKASPMQKAVAMTKINPQAAVQLMKGQEQAEQAKQIAQSDAQVMQSLGIAPPAQGAPKQIQQSNQPLASMQQISQRFQPQQLPQAQEKPMPGGLGLTGKQYAPVAQMQEPEAAQQVQQQQKPRDIYDYAMKAPMEEVLQARSNIQNPEIKKNLDAIIKHREAEAANEAKIQAHVASGDQQFMKEQRSEIAKAAEPYSNSGQLSKNVRDLRQAAHLIKNKRVSFDENVVRTIGAALAEGKDSAVAELIKTPDQQKLFSLLRSQLKTKQEGGSNPSQREVLLSLTAIPSYLKTQEANEFLVENLLDEAELAEIRGQIQNQVRKNRDLTYPEFNEIVAEQMKPYEEEVYARAKTRNEYLSAKSQVADKIPPAGKIFMFDPKSGAIFEAPIEERAVLEAKKMQVLPSQRSR